ncbi:MAG TPA: toxin-antitoxin system HicB family antitoxin [Stellaceae bacterium]|nr:toxin-antitoxin system HicB family antitoxin [Stellaceae bacterium]
MNFTTFPLRLPEDLKEAAAEQAAAMGVSLNQYVGMSLAARVGAQAEAARFFAARGARGSSERALAVLDRLGSTEALSDDDRLDTPAAEPRLPR